MSEFPKQFAFPDPLVTISSYSSQSIGGNGMGNNTAASATYVTANLAIFIPFRIARPMTITQLFLYNGATASGNIDLGIFSVDGVNIVSAGSTAQTGTNALQAISIASTQIGKGLFYMACAMDNTTGTVFRANIGLQTLNFTGCAQMASAFPLPATAVFASCASTTNLPWMGLTGRSVL